MQATRSTSCRIELTLAGVAGAMLAVDGIIKDPLPKCESSKHLKSWFGARENWRVFPTKLKLIALLPTTVMCVCVCVCVWVGGWVGG
jgi:hypothetical protein